MEILHSVQVLLLSFWVQKPSPHTCMIPANFICHTPEKASGPITHKATLPQYSSLYCSHQDTPVRAAFWHLCKATHILAPEAPPFTMSPKHGPLQWPFLSLLLCFVKDDPKGKSTQNMQENVKGHVKYILWNFIG